MNSDSPPIHHYRTARRSTLLIVLAGAAAFRFAALGRQPLWLDEAADAYFASRPFWSCVFAEHVHPPLYRSLLHFAFLAFGNSSIALRLLPAIFGVLTIPAILLLARRIFPETEFTVAIAAAASPFLIYFSQESRNYSLFILLTVVSTWAFLRFYETQRGLVLYSAVSVLLIYTHYLAAFVLLAHEITYWIHLRRRIHSWIVGRAILLAAFAPWLLWASRHYWTESRLFYSPLWLVPVAILRMVLGYGVVVSDAWRAQSVWSRVVQEAPVLLPSILVFGWLLWRGIQRLMLTDSLRTLFAAMFLLPWTILLLLAPWIKLVQERYLVFQAPFLLMLLAAGLCSLRSAQRILATASIVLITAFALTAYYAAPGSLLGYRLRYGKEAWPTAAAFIRQQQADTVIVAPGYLNLALDRYPLDVAREIRMPQNSSILPDLQGARRVALVTSHAASPQDQIRAELDATFQRVGKSILLPQNSIRVDVYDTSIRASTAAKLLPAVKASAD